MSVKNMRVKFHSELKENDPDTFEANITVDYTIDKNYGADADGKRGMETLFINEITVQSCIDSQANLVELPLNDRMMDDVWQYVWEQWMA